MGKLDSKGLEKALDKDTGKIKQYVMRSKICNSGYMEMINQMILEDHTYKEITEWAKKKGITLTPAQISKHKKMLPHLTEVKWEEDDDVSDVARYEASKDRFMKEKEMNNVELAINTLQETVKASQITAVNHIWADIVPQLLDNIKDFIKEENRHRINFKDTMDGLDKIIKIGQLLENKPTIIEAQNINGKQEVKHTHDHKLNSVGDGSADSVGKAALEAINSVNQALEKYTIEKSESDDTDNTTH